MPMPDAENDGARIYWEEQGRGEPVLLIMGLGATLDPWYRLWPSLSASHRAVLLDNRGVGRTGTPEPPYSIPQMADDAIAVLDAAGVDVAHVIGASMGGGDRAGSRAPASPACPLVGSRVYRVRRTERGRPPRPRFATPWPPARP
jgi:pimeloyl-ACP methyl ester carboxylesterase